VRVAEKNDKLNLPYFSVSVLNYLSWTEQAQSFESLGAVGGANFNLTGRGEAEQFAGSTITPSLFPLLGLKPVRGRAFSVGEERPGSAPRHRSRTTGR
jgi:putative ABC transport system permease protein